MMKYDIKGNDTYTIKCNELVRVSILSGDIVINGIDNLPLNTVLYYMSDVQITGNGSIKYNVE